MIQYKYNEKILNSWIVIARRASCS